ncbi:hypothetical protein SPAR_17130 [Streptomyces sparsogenes DSM 40356]|uniref:Uncharacterized protein n=1 Tax=Streptomyces sparsogenes DSM 40356 TaxID=1331668 RepID=A0A1R1SJM4_9ACTN|nr:hypothetical protein [Streptomyces sparsogenes]OMI38219.1 hypothetical protein SPAR_17130 [Streptomyces sparsogenes DSM 40356]
MTSGLGRVRADVRVLRCFWGEEHGAALGLGGVSIPVRTRNRGVGGDGPLDEDDPLAVWALLEADPLAELREYAEAAKARRGGVARVGYTPGRRDPWQDTADKVRGLSLGAVADAEGGLGELAADLAPHLGAAGGRVAHEISRSLVGTPPADGIEGIAARAVYALAVRSAEGPQGAGEPLPVDGADRDTLVGALTDQLGGTDRGGAVAGAAKGIAVRALNSYLSPISSLAHRYRGRITGGSVPASGDILRYQVRGAGVRAAIRTAVREAAESGGGPVVLLAHSLGGIACVDLLADATEPPPEVGLLVTVGSQAPFLYELDALTSLRRDEPLPDTFPRWINVYDEHDLLGFVGEKVFPDRVTDLRVNTRQPFPRAHTSYFAHQRLYELLAPELPR